MTKYGAYVEFEGSSLNSATSRIVAALAVADINADQINVSNVEEDTSASGVVQINGKSTLQEYMDSLPSVGQDVVPDDPFKYPHIQAIMNNLKWNGDRYTPQGEGDWQLRDDTGVAGSEIP
jgi:hypothetical protein